MTKQARATVQMKLRVPPATRDRVAAEAARTGLSASRVIEKLVGESLPPGEGEARAGIMTLPDGAPFFCTAACQEELELAFREARLRTLRRMRKGASRSRPQPGSPRNRQKPA